MTALPGTTPTTPTTPRDLQVELLARLGLDENATASQVAAAHEAVEAFLAGAPRHLAGWARHEASAADMAYALLTDPAALARSAALVGAAARLDPTPDGPATPPVRREQPAPEAPTLPAAQVITVKPVVKAAKNGKAASTSIAAAGITPTSIAAAGGSAKRAADRAADAEPTDDELAALIAEVTPSAHRDRVTGGAPAKPRAAAPSGQDAESGSSPRLLTTKRLGIAGAVIAGAVVLVFVGFTFGGGGRAAALNGGDGAAAASQNPGIDEAKVSADMVAIQQNPKDVTALQDIADQYYNAQDYATAATFLDKIIAIDPSNIRALLGRGAAAFNQADAAGAQEYWTQALKVDPNSAEAHYDLGFLYLNESDYTNMKKEWETYLTLDPSSTTAASVRQHLAALDAQLAASASPAASGSAAPAASPATSAPTPAATPGSPATPAATPATTAAPAATPVATPAVSPAP